MCVCDRPQLRNIHIQNNESEILQESAGIAPLIQANIIVLIVTGLVIFIWENFTFTMRDWVSSCSCSPRSILWSGIWNYAHVQRARDAATSQTSPFVRRKKNLTEVEKRFLLIAQSIMIISPLVSNGFSPRFDSGCWTLSSPITICADGVHLQTSSHIDLWPVTFTPRPFGLWRSWLL